MIPAALSTPQGAEATAADLDAPMQSSALLAETMDLMLCQRKRRTKVRGDLVKDKLVYPAWPSTMATGHWPVRILWFYQRPGAPEWQGET